jgi:hypothetical protein
MKSSFIIILITIFSVSITAQNAQPKSTVYYLKTAYNSTIFNSASYYHTAHGSWTGFKLGLGFQYKNWVIEFPIERRAAAINNKKIIYDAKSTAVDLGVGIGYKYLYSDRLSLTPIVKYKKGSLSNIGKIHYKGFGLGCDLIYHIKNNLGLGLTTSYVMATMDVSTASEISTRFKKGDHYSVGIMMSIAY